MDADQELGPGGTGHEFGVLGETIGRAAGRRVDLGPARQRAVLAALLVDAGNPVSLDQLTDRVWGGAAPLRAAGALRTYVSRLRGVLVGMGHGGIQREPGGYVIDVGETAVDLQRFRRLAERGRTGASDAAGDLFEQALGLWRGDALADLDTPWAADVRHSLEAERFAVRLDRNDARLRMGRHTELLADLAALVAANPLDERVAGQHITALYRSGRQADALAAYDRIRRRLADELGVDPGPVLQQLHQWILSGDPAAMAAPQRASGEPAPSDRTVPRQLPSAVPGFVGRATQLERLDGVIAEAEPDRRPHAGPVVVAAIDGTAGVGKTALAVHWAQRVAHRFPDGQLYVNLRGYGADDPVEPTDALERMLRSLDVAPERIPAGLDERSALLRSQLAERRILVLLDNARDSDQVRPLLPGAGGMIVITSRRRLRALSVRDGAQHIALDMLSVPEAVNLLAAAIGHDRVERERPHAEEIVTLCARLPLALRLAAERIDRVPAAPLAGLAAELADQRGRLGMLSIDESPDTDLRSVFTWSYGALDPDAARMFALLGLHPRTGISVGAAAALAGVAPARAARLLDRLADVSLLEQRFPGRYELHDLLCDFALEQHLPDRPAARARLAHWYVHTAAGARARLVSTRHRMPIADMPPAGVTPVEFASLHEAVAWFDVERQAIVDIVKSAGEHGHPGSGAVLFQLSWAYFYMRGYWQPMIDIGEAAVRHAAATGDRFVEAKCCNGLGAAYGRLRGKEQQIVISQRAFEMFEELGELAEQATSLLNIGSAYNMLERFADARGALERAHDLYLEVGDPLYAGFALNNLAESHLGLGLLDEALDRSHRALESLRDGGEQFRLVAAFETIARIHVARDDHRSAIQHYRNALDVANRTRTTNMELPIRIALGEQLSVIGEHAEAIAIWREAHRIGVAANDPAVVEIERLLASTSGMTAAGDAL
jgi:DNA-binding SARP family transcriptional activator